MAFNGWKVNVVKAPIREDTNAGLIVLYFVPITLRPATLFDFLLHHLWADTCRQGRPFNDHNHHHCHEESLRLRCEFKTVWWRQSTRWTSCGREWKCLQIRSFSSELRQERQNWEILVLSLSWYKCDHTSDILTILARTVALISMNVRPKAGLI